MKKLLSLAVFLLGFALVPSKTVAQVTITCGQFGGKCWQCTWVPNDGSSCKWTGRGDNYCSPTLCAGGGGNQE